MTAAAAATLAAGRDAPAPVWDDCMPLVTAAIHSFLYFFVYVGAGSFPGAMLFGLFGIALVGLHVLVWAVARFAGTAWAVVAAFVANAAYALVGILWPTPVPGTSRLDWTVNAI